MYRVTILVLLQPVLFSLYQNFDQPLCEQMFHWLCVAEDTRMQLSACTLLVRMCGLQQWWGDFLVSTLTKLYSSHQTSIFPQDRYFNTQIMLHTVFSVNILILYLPYFLSLFLVRQHFLSSIPKQSSTTILTSNHCKHNVNL